MTAEIRSKAGDILKKLIPLRRLGSPADVAAVAAFLASPESAYLTGQVMTMDGGLGLGAAPVG